MKSVTITSLVEECILELRGYRLSRDDLGHISAALLGGTVRDWVRKPAERAIIGHSRFGLDARRIDEEFRVLERQSSEVLGLGDMEGGVKAAAFFFLRFENIHPLRDGNGRVGRLLLAFHCSRYVNVEIQEFLDTLSRNAVEYRHIFTMEASRFRFELLVDLLARLFGVEVNDVSLPHFGPNPKMLFY